MEKKRILIIVGSLRKQSFNRRLAEKAAEFLESRADVRFLNYSALPYMNQDIEFPAPEEVKRVRKEIMESDGIWIFTPEYNYNIPGVLKNLLDWLSRPLQAEDAERITAVTGKAVTISGAGGKNAAATVRAHLDNLLSFMKMNLMKVPETGVSVGADGFAADSLTLTSEDASALRQQADAFLTFLQNSN